MWLLSMLEPRSPYRAHEYTMRVLALEAALAHDNPYRRDSFEWGQKPSPYRLWGMSEVWAHE